MTDETDKTKIPDDEKGTKTEGDTDIGEITKILTTWSEARKESLDTVFPVVYDMLRQIAKNTRKNLFRDTTDDNLNTTALVHEMYVKLTSKESINFQDKNRIQFYGFCKVAMHNLLVDYLRRASNKYEHVSSEEHGLENDPLVNEIDFPNSQLNSVEKKILINEALSGIEDKHPRKVDILLLKYEYGFTEDEIAEKLGISDTTVKRDARLGRALLQDAILKGETNGPDDNDPGRVS